MKKVVNSSKHRVRYRSAQGATELIIVFAMALVILSVIIVLNQDTYSSVSGRFESEKAKKLVNDIGDAANLVYQQGAGASTRIYATIPAGIEKVNISGNQILLTMNINGVSTDIVRSTSFPIIGNITTSPGNIWLNINSQEGHVVVNSTFTQVSATCGNNVRESGEDCDGFDLGLYTCGTLGYTGGSLFCNPDCTFNTSTCYYLFNTAPFINWTNATPASVNGGDIVKIRAYVYDADDNLDTVTLGIQGNNYTMLPFEEYARYTVFSETFEDANLSDWTLSGTGTPWYNTTNDPQEGSYHAQASDTGNNKLAYLEKNINTSDMTGLNISYYRKLTEMDSLGEFIVDWSDGTSWTILEDVTVNTNDSTYLYHSYLLPVTAEDNPNFSIRFGCENNNPNEMCKVDNIQMTADTMAPAPNQYYYDINTSGFPGGLITYNIYANDSYSYNATPKPGSFTITGDTTPPATVTGLDAQSNGTTWIYWTWTNPGDIDFSQAIIYINGTNIANTSNNYYNATALSPSTTYQINVNTKDTTGNVNTTSVTDLASTEAGADIYPPGTITSLAEQSVGTTWIYWTWTNPIDLDFAEVILYLNGTNVANTSNNFYNATGLTASTTYQLSTNTKDTTGNINTTWVNDTATTSSGVDTTPPGSVTGLGETATGTTWIYWQWTNPGDIDFSQTIIYINGTNVANTSNAYYNATGLSSSTTYEITVHTKDTTGNVNATDVSDLATTQSADVTVTVYAQTCTAEDDAAKGTFGSACDGTYPASCPSDLLTCNDGSSETHLAVRSGKTRNYGGVKISSYNSTVTCNSIVSVNLCYEWWQSATLQDCDISVDADGGASYTTMTTVCPGNTANPGIVCTDVTGLETWSCGNFFGPAGTRAQVKSEAQRAGGAGTTTIFWDALYYEVTYN